MHPTPASLLERLRGAPGADDWERFVALYSPALFGWARQAGMSDEDAADLVQDVLTLLVRKLPEFRYDPSQSFRAWLRIVLLNRRRETLRRQSVPAAGAELGDEQAAGLDSLLALEQHEHAAWITARALQIMQREFEPTTWRACWEQVVEERPAAEVAAELGITVGAAYAARSRVLRRLRQELDGLLD